jgi:hypothetical protein
MIGFIPDGAVVFLPASHRRQRAGAEGLRLTRLASLFIVFALGGPGIPPGITLGAHRFRSSNRWQFSHTLLFDVNGDSETIASH